MLVIHSNTLYKINVLYKNNLWVFAFEPVIMQIAALCDIHFQSNSECKLLETVTIYFSHTVF